MLHALRFLGSAFTIVGVASTVVPLQPSDGSDIRADRAAGDGESKQSCTPADQCCRICSKGKACGKSCIPQSSTCHKGRGCACNADEVCE
jgi:hypothetical protein